MLAILEWGIHKHVLFRNEYFLHEGINDGAINVVDGHTDIQTYGRTLFIEYIRLINQLKASVKIRRKPSRYQTDQF